MNRKSQVLLLGTALFSTMMVGTLSAQLVSASLEGIVRDPSAGVVPGASGRIQYPQYSGQPESSDDVELLPVAPLPAVPPRPARPMSQPNLIEPLPAM